MEKRPLLLLLFSIVKPNDQFSVMLMFMYESLLVTNEIHHGKNSEDPAKQVLLFL